MKRILVCFSLVLLFYSCNCRHRITRNSITSFTPIHMVRIAEISYNSQPATSALSIVLEPIDKSNYKAKKKIYFDRINEGFVWKIYDIGMFNYKVDSIDIIKNRNSFHKIDLSEVKERTHETLPFEFQKGKTLYLDFPRSDCNSIVYNIYVKENGKLQVGRDDGGLW